MHAISRCFLPYSSLTLSLLAIGSASALESFAIGPRALGMGGANTACTDDVQAQYYNPAAFGFFNLNAPPAEQSDQGADSVDNNALWRKKWGFALDAGLGIRVQGDIASYLDRVKNLSDAGSIDQLSTTGVNSANAQSLVEFASSLGNLANPRNAISTDVTAGFAVRVGHVGVGIRSLNQLTARVSNVDFANLGLGGVGNLNAQMAGVTPAGNDAQTSLFTPAQQAQLGTAGLNAAAIQKLDFLARQSGVSPAEAQAMTNVLAGIATNSGGALNTNATAARLYGIGLIEVPVSYGYAINEHVAVGGNLKLIAGRVYGTDVMVINNGSNDILNDAKSNYQQTITWGLDLAVMARFSMLNLGLTGRNLNRPTLKGPTVGAIRYPDFDLDPAPTAGAAFIPWSWITIEGDLDLTSNHTTLPGYDTQNLRLGLELNPWHFIAIRAGGYKNLAEDDIGTVVTAGLGVNLWAIRLDLAGAMAHTKATFDGKQIPREARAGLQLAVDF